MYIMLNGVVVGDPLSRLIVAAGTLPIILRLEFRDHDERDRILMPASIPVHIELGPLQ